jgi:hypothetical protein
MICQGNTWGRDLSGVHIVIAKGNAPSRSPYLVISNTSVKLSIGSMRNLSIKIISGKKRNNKLNKIVRHSKADPGHFVKFSTMKSVKGLLPFSREM